MWSSACLYLLDEPHVRVGDVRHDLVPSRPVYLLIYLACRGEWVGREALAGLFWPDRPEEEARHNLRVVLHRAKALPWAGGLEVERERVRLRMDTDTAHFRQALGQAHWERAVRLHRRPFLQGFPWQDAPALEDWATLERESLREAWQQAARHHAEALQQAEQHAEACRLLAEILRQNLLSEDIVQDYLRAAYLAGQREAALKVYERFVQELKQELGLEPLRATQELAQALRRNESAQIPGEKPHPKHNLPGFNTRFVGRQLELAALERKLTNPECRLLTLVGLGGMGKTRLAVELAQRMADRFADGVWFVPLVGVETPDLLVASIASALSLGLRGPTDPKTQLRRYLQYKEMLLLLDNFERLQAEAGLLEDLLQAPGLRLVVTSRVALELPSEWLFDLGGLTYPPLHTEEPLGNYDAVRFFYQRAERQNLSLEPSASTLEAMAELCRRVEGMPLALELAATWLRVLSLEELLAQVSHSLGVLPTEPHFPEHQHSLQAIMDYSYGLLSEAQQAALARLAVFPGGFSLEAAEQVAGAHLGRLLQLINHALLRRSSDGRYQMHELVRQFALEQLQQSNEARTVYEKLLGYFRTLADQAESHLGSEQQLHWLARLDAEADNLHHVLDWGYAHNIPEAVLLTVSLGRYWEATGRWQGGAFWVRQALAHLDQVPSEVQARLFLKALGMAVGMDDHSAAQALAPKALERCKQAGIPEFVAEYHNLMGWLATNRQQFHKAQKHLQKSLELAQKSRCERVENHALLNLGNLALKQNRLEEAGLYLERSLKLAQARQDARLEMISLANWTGYLLGRQAYARSVELCETALALAQRLEHPFYKALIQGNLGYALWQLGDYPAAEPIYRAHVLEFFELGNLAFFSENALELAAFWSHLGFTEEAVRLWFAVEGLRQKHGYPVFEGYLELRQRVMGSVLPEQLASLQQAGETMSAPEIRDFIRQAARFPQPETLV
ncbi:ATP-binding protein [Meiothermus granaticius]|uniref:Putative HTH-type transcriptional regulator n=1 Tax=Meiothermus granaticius NBRC 107808 TaxID=1227551 RepID=A0A399F2X5_9DEIN|nr:BTAD domain-containing putative transcriptional regulator [Meiothermus granaticius]RIH91054.1 putative HTH-type transcriptional regulator [Meiothermus granaticius NBRC 107808]GEM86510.1 transcriptional activator [Meiothermus granaticius NBRC 107808]